MKRNHIQILALIVTLICCACSNDVGLDELRSDPKLVLYCFPNVDNDTTIISLTASRPMYQNNLMVSANDMYGVRDAHITYTVNGEKHTVFFTEEKTDLMPPRSYYVTGHHQVGDHIRIEASVDGLPSVQAETVIPDMPFIDEVKDVMIHRDNQKFRQFQVTIADNPDTNDFYAVRLEMESSNNSIVTVTNATINTDDEPALKAGGSIDDLLDDENTFYGQFYIFNDDTFNDNRYTLHLNVNEYDIFHANTDMDDTTRKVHVKLYKITPEYFRFIKSINDQTNYELGEYGLAPTSPTFNHVDGGLGVIGGFNMTEHVVTITQNNFSVSNDK
ncbi:MAG: DUF4249 domain-containing protein [Prevotella sp.]|nr:DUF4249 domain-containing protein [Prevotella sp.]